MKKCLSVLIVAFLLLPLSVFAQAEPMLWPVPKTISPADKPTDSRAGLGILHAPQSYIGEELNFSDLFITAPEGTPVVAPADGVVEIFGLNYKSSLQYMTGGRLQPGDDVEKESAEFAGQLRGKSDPRYINVSIGIRLTDGRCMYISGLKTDKILRTGERVTRGQQLGRVGYSYVKIKEPSINLSISDRSGKPADPMTPFGIPTTFIPPKAIPEITSLTGEQAREDFTVLMDVLREAYPGLHDAVTPDELERYCNATLASFPEKMEFDTFYLKIKRSVGKLHDSHINIYQPEKYRKMRSIDLPQIYFGRIDSALVALRTTKPYASYYGRHIRSVNGIPADSVCRIVEQYVGGYDAGVQSVPDYFLALGASQIFSNVYPGTSHKCDMTLEFEDGEKIDVPGWTYTGRDDRGLAPDWKDFILTNYYPKDSFGTKMLNDSTAYLGLSTFNLNQVEVDSVASFIRSVAARPNMIVDLRNNGGGEVKVLNRILSFFATQPFVDLGSYAKVAKQGNFKSFAHCMNYAADDEIFTDFQPVEGKEGYYSYEDVGQIIPDTTTLYGGRLYVLINEESCSAATLFPATILRNHRGVIVGRETATAYHFMNALKFADIRLPNSWLTVRIPLVRCVFDETQNSRIPYGRGVIPDHEVRLSLDEVASVRGDSILNYTMALIDRGEYLGEDPFAVSDTPVCRWQLPVLIAAIAAVVVGGLFFFLRRKK